MKPGGNVVPLLHSYTYMLDICLVIKSSPQASELGYNAHEQPANGPTLAIICRSGLHAAVAQCHTSQV